MTAINYHQKIPIPETTIFKGERMYYRFVRHKDVMRIFQGVGISTSVLKLLNKNMRIMFYYRGKSEKDKYIYIAEIKQFVESKKKHRNAGFDAQLFVSFEDMKEVII